MPEEKIKVIFGINDFAVGGAQRLIVDQLKYLDIEKFELVLITLFNNVDRGNLFSLLPAGIKIYKLDFKYFYNLKEWFRLFKIIKKEKPAIVLSSIFFSNMVFRLIKFFLNYQCIIVEHNTYINKSRFECFIDKILSLFTFKIVGVSPTVVKFTSQQEKIKLDKFICISNGIDIEAISKIKDSLLADRENLKKRFGYKIEDKIIINVSRLLDQKNHRLLIESFFEFQKFQSDYKLLIVGGGPLAKELDNLVIKLNLQNKIKLVGEQLDVWPYYSIADFFVLSSRIEGFGLVLIEAMLFGLPAVSTIVAGADYFIKDGYNGFLVEHDKSAIAEKMKILADLNQSEKEIFKANCLAIAAKFDIKDNVREYEKLFFQCLNK